MKEKLFYLWILLIPISVVRAQCFTTISMGSGHVLAQKTDGSLWVWGYGNLGQLNNTTNIDQYSPIVFAPGTNWQKAQTGLLNSFVIKTNGTLWGCGSNLYGSLGVGSTVDHVSTLTQIGTASNWKEIAPADYFTVGIKTDNSLWAWGQNVYFQLGDGTTINRTTPVQIGGTNDWKTVASNKCNATVAIKLDGTLWGWGANSCSIFGDSDISAYQTPQQLTLSTDTDWDKIVGGGGQFLALKTNGTLWGWGAGSVGQIGLDPSIIQVYVLYQIPGFWKAIGAGFQFSMGIKTDGTLWQWGKNDVGDSSQAQVNYSFIPFQIGTASNWESISCGRFNVVALRTDGSLWTWGNNSNGQLGNGTNINVSSPTQIQITGCDLGISNPSEELNFIISPNPVESQVTVDYKGVLPVDTIVLYDSTGKEVYTIEALGNSSFTSSFGLSQLSSGNYVISLDYKGKHVISKQFVKK